MRQTHSPFVIKYPKRSIRVQVHSEQIDNHVPVVIQSQRLSNHFDDGLFLVGAIQRLWVGTKKKKITSCTQFISLSKYLRSTPIDVNAKYIGLIRFGRNQQVHVRIPVKVARHNARYFQLTEFAYQIVGALQQRFNVRTE